MSVLMSVGVRVRLFLELVRAVRMGVLVVVGMRVFMAVGCFFTVWFMVVHLWVYLQSLREKME